MVLTRLAGRTAASMPERESVAGFAAHGATMAVFLSAARPVELQRELLAGGSGYTAETPAAIVVRASWPDEQVVTTTVGRLAAALDARRRDPYACSSSSGPALRGAGRPLPPLRATVRAHVPEAVAPGVDRGQAGVSVHVVTREPISRRGRGALEGPTRRLDDGHVRERRRQGCRRRTGRRHRARAGRGRPAFGAAGELPGRERAPEPVRRREGRRRRSRLHRRRPGDGRGGLGAPGPSTELRAGPGVGTITKPGLGLEVGAPAINPVPRRMILAALRRGDRPAARRDIHGARR